MAIDHKFRSAFRGFNREDVVHYIEFVNSKHSAQVNQLTSEAEELRSQVKALQASPALKQELDAAQAQCADLSAQLEESRQEILRLQAQIQEHEQNLATKELEAYRRAEQAERVAKERADAIYQQAAGTLAEATTQVEQASETFQKIADEVSGQLGQLQSAVNSSKTALSEAAATMYAIRPETEE